ncbi:MAG TPA: helix-turn-helix domain-containing protein [Turneriella sp.]|nr:helix-turn-helix domain-containing protein [Turneriella sp.]
MRIFIEHKADILPVVERGRIVGQLDRMSIMEALSEIRPEGCLLALKEAESTEELLRRLDSSEAGGLPTVNRAYEFNALWGRAEILQAQGKIPQVKIWQPETASTPAVETVAKDEPTSAVFAAATQEPVTNLSNLSELAARAAVIDKPIHGEKHPDPKPAAPGATITIVREAPAVAPRTAHRTAAEEPAPEAANLRAPAEKFHRELERGRLAINTLAALELPLMACDGGGSELFHNRAFGDLRRRFAHSLDSGELVKKAKDAIADSALKGDLDIDRPVKLRANVTGHGIFCKAIRDFDNPSARAQGYIFWLEPVAAPASISADWSASSNSQEGNGFAGRTLPEILAEEESRAMAWAMREANGNQSDAALLLGIPRQTFNYRFRKLARQQASRGGKKNAEQQQAGKTQ